MSWNDYDRCEDCGCEGCSPNCPGPANVGTCPKCGSSTGNGKCSDPQGCGYGWPGADRVQMYPVFGD